jgi:hypothetical protein
MAAEESTLRLSPNVNVTLSRMASGSSIRRQMSFQFHQRARNYVSPFLYGAGVGFLRQHWMRVAVSQVPRSDPINFAISWLC